MEAELARLLEALQPRPLLLSNLDAAAYVGMSPRVWGEAKARGELPKPVLVPGRDEPMYRRADLDAWVAKLPKAASALPRQRETASA